MPAAAPPRGAGLPGPASLPRLLNLLGLLGLLCMLFLARPALATPPLVLDDATPRIEAWPAVTVLSDPEGTLTLEQVLAARARFTVPEGASATLGLRKDVVWLHIPLQVAASSDAAWILDINYAALNRADVHLLLGDRLVQQRRMGNMQPPAERPFMSRSHALLLDLAPGQRAELLLRVQTQGGMILPITLNKPSAFHAAALQEQLLQGLLTGLGLCLLIYSLAQWASVREAMFLKYALLISGSLMFSVAQFGLGALYLWPGSLWMEQHVAGRGGAGGGHRHLPLRAGRAGGPGAPARAERPAVRECGGAAAADGSGLHAGLAARAPGELGRRHAGPDAGADRPARRHCARAARRPRRLVLPGRLGRLLHLHLHHGQRHQGPAAGQLAGRCIRSRSAPRWTCCCSCA